MSFDPLLMGIPMMKWLTALAAFFFVWFGLSLLKRVAVKRLMIFAKRTTSDIDDFLVRLLEKTKSWFLLVVAFTAAAHYLAVSNESFKSVHSIFIVGLWLQVGFWGDDSIRFFLLRFLKRRETKAGSDPALETTISALQFLCRLVLYALILLLILDNLGFNITTLIAGLGVGGIAVALAAQNILGDLFASLSIVLDRPFVIGDFIEVGAQRGRVERIGLKTTRIRSVTGEQIIMSNTDLLHSRILNFERLQEKRVALQIGVTYKTSPEDLRGIPEILKAVISAQEKARFEFAYFKSFGDSSLNFEAIYFVMSRKGLDHIRVEESVNFGVFEALQKAKIEFAYPTRTLIMDKSA